jgi:hypothetical protein
MRDYAKLKLLVIKSHKKTSLAMDDIIDIAAEMEDVRAMGMAGAGDDDNPSGYGGEANLGPRMPRRFNMVVSTTEYHKLIAARDNILHPKLRTGVNLQGSYYAVDAFRDLYPNTRLLPGYGSTLQRFAQTWSRCAWKVSGRCRGAMRWALELHEAARTGLGKRGYAYSPLPQVSDTAMHSWEAWDTLHRGYQRLRGRFQRERFPVQVIRKDHCTIAMTANGAAHRYAGSDCAFFYPVSALLMIMDSLEKVAKTNLACEITRPDLTELPDLYKRALNAQRAIIIQYGDSGYEIAKGLEPLAKTYASDVSGGHHGYGKSSFEKMIEKFIIKEKAAGGDGTLVTALGDVVAECISIEDATELSGMMATFGYPVIDVVSSGAKAKESGTSPDNTTYPAVSEMVCLFQHLILKNYVRLHCQYPPIIFTKSGTMLERMHRARYLDIVDGSYPLSDWQHAEMHDLFEFMYHEDYLELIADKSTLEPKSRAKDFYNGALTEVTLKRLVAKVLNTSIINTKDDVDAFAREVWPDEWRRCRLVPKEQEHKRDARMFVVLAAQIRRALSIIQENVKELFFPLIPYTSMAMTGQQLTEALHEATRGEGKYKLELDLSGWNLKFRERLTRPFGYLMDKMAGVRNLFGGSHRFFSGAEFCMSNRDTKNTSLESPWYPKEVSPSDMLWQNDDSGKEGIEQRFWTVITEVMIYRCLWRHRLPFRLLGQADNQTLVIDMASIPRERRGEKATEIEADIEAGCAECNHECKPEEFLGSMTVLTYSKNFYVNGRLIPQVVKPAARITHGSSDSLETLEDDVGGLASSAYTAAANAPDPLLVWALGAFMTHTYLSGIGIGANQYGPIDQVEANKLLTTHSTWCIPPVLGGLPIVPIGAYVYKGDPDPLSHAIASLQVLSSLKDVRSYLEYLDSEDPYTERPDALQLMLNPYGLPLAATKTGASVMEEFSLSYIASSRNVHVRELASLAAAAKDPLIAAVSSIRPVVPSMVSDILDASILGRASRVAKKFTAAGTLLRMAPYETQVGAFQAALRRVQSVNLRFLGAATYPGYVPSQLSYHVAERLRLKWGLGASGIIGASVAQPLDYDILSSVGHGVVCVTRCDPDLTVTGPCAPYLGSKTMERRGAEKYEIVRTPSTVDLGKMVLSATAGTVTPEVRQIYESVCASRCSIPFTELTQLLPNTVSGSPGHRYESLHGARLIGPVGNPGPRTWVETNTDNIPGISGSSLDYPIPMQSFMSAVVTAACLSIRAHRPRRVFRIGLVASEYPQLPDADRTATVPAPTMQALPHNPLAHVSSLRILRTAPRIGTPTVHKAHRVGLLTGLFTLILCGKRTGNMAADTGDTRAISGVDIAAATSQGSERILLCATRACILATTWHMTWFTEQKRWRHAEDILVDNLCAAMASHLYLAVTHPMTDKCYALELGIGRENPGTSGHANAVRFLQRRLVGSVRHDIRSPTVVQASWKDIQFPEISRTAPPVFLTRLQLGVVTWITLLNANESVIGTFKELIRKTWKEVDTDNPISTNIQVAGGKRVVARAALLAADKMLPTDIRLEDPCIISGDDTSAWRLLRNQEGAPSRPPVCVPVLEVKVPEVHLCTIESIGPRASMPPPPQYLSASRGNSHIVDRIARITGDRSTVAAVWGPHLAKLRGATLVVGTGSGGIQAALDGLGLKSDGIDLATIIPPGRTASLGWVPGDIAGRPLAKLSSVMWDTSGDWFEDGGRLALARGEYNNIIIDIERGRVRYGTELLDPLSFSNWRGKLLVRMFLIPSELNEVVSWMIARGFKPQVAATSGLPPREDSSSAYIITGQYAPGTTATMYCPYRVMWTHPRYAMPHDPLIARRNAARDFTGGLEDRLDIPDMYTHCLARAQTASNSRGNTEQGQALMYTRLACTLHPVRQLYEMDWSDILITLREPPSGMRLGKLTVQREDSHMIYLHKKVLPRYIGSCLIERHSHNTGSILHKDLAAYFSRN